MGELYWHVPEKSSETRVSERCEMDVAAIHGSMGIPISAPTAGWDAAFSLGEERAPAAHRAAVGVWGPCQGGVRVAWGLFFY